MNIRTVVRVHLFRERLDVLICVLAPLIIMLESGYANGWTFAGGNLDPSSMNTYIALARGVFLEALIYAMFKLVKLFILKGGWYLSFSLIPLAIGLLGMVVSAGCNLGWVNNSGEMSHVVATVNVYLPHLMAQIFQVGLGLLFPVAVGAFALFDVSHLVEDMFASSSLDQKATIVEKAQNHQNLARKGQKQAANDLKDEYLEMARVDARNMVDAVKKGDYSFGMNELQTGPLDAPTSVKRVTPVLPAGSPPPLQLGNPFQPQVPAFSTQSTTIPLGTLSTGNTQQLSYPTPSMPSIPPAQNRGAKKFPNFGK